MICNYVFHIFNLEDKVVFEGDRMLHRGIYDGMVLT